MKSEYIGKQFGQWTILEFSHKKPIRGGYDHYYVCRCSCGLEKPVLLRSLRRGASKACMSCSHSKGAKWKTRDGYVVMTASRHPNARAGGDILEHVYIMSEHLGRPLYPTERVHHIDGNRENNSIDNLELWDIGQPPGQRVQDKIEHYIQFLQQHGYVVLNNDKN